MLAEISLHDDDDGVVRHGRKLSTQRGFFKCRIERSLPAITKNFSKNHLETASHLKNQAMGKKAIVLAPVPNTDPPSSTLRQTTPEALWKKYCFGTGVALPIWVSKCSVASACSKNAIFVWN